MLEPSEIRFEVRRFLASRPTAAVPVESIIFGLRRIGTDITKEEAAAALTFWKELPTPQVKFIRTDSNAHLWQITSAGVVGHENND